MAEAGGAAEAVRSMLDAVSRFYASEAGGARRRRAALVVATADGARGRTGSRGAWRTLGARARTVAPNAMERLRARLRSRPPVLARAFSVGVAFEGAVEINPHNGTVVVLGDERVDKFHLKELEYFDALYGVVAPAAPFLEPARGEGLLRIRMPRFAALASSLTDAELLALSAGPLAALRARTAEALGQRERFTLRSKVRQIFRCYRGASDPDIPEHLEAAGLLEARMASFPLALCHGDLWRGNLLRDAGSGTVLIDPDKALLGPAAYDPVHLLLMHRSIEARIDIARLLARLGEQGEEAARYLSRHGGSLGATDPAEVRFSVLLYAFLKGVEWDARHGPARSCLPGLGRALAAVD